MPALPFFVPVPLLPPCDRRNAIDLLSLKNLQPGGEQRLTIKNLANCLAATQPDRGSLGLTQLFGTRQLAPGIIPNKKKTPAAGGREVNERGI